MKTHFDSFSDMRQAGVTQWPWRGNDRLDFIGIRIIVQHSVMMPAMRPGDPDKIVYRYLVQTRDGQFYSIPKQAQVALTSATKGLPQNKQPLDVEFTITRDGAGMHTVYNAFWCAAGVAPAKHYSEVEVKVPAPVAHAKGPCKCPIKDLTSTGHNSGCDWKRS